MVSCALAGGAQAEEALAPPQVADLFIRVLVHADPDAMQALNSYLRPARSERAGDFMDIDKMIEADRSLPARLVPGFLKPAPMDEADKAALVPDVQHMLEAVREAQKRTVCTTGEAVPVTERVPKGLVSVMVPYSCKVVNPAEKVTGLIKRSAVGGWTVEQYREGLAMVAEAYRTAPLTQDFSGQLPLSAQEGSNIWQNNFPRESLNIATVLY